MNVRAEVQSADTLLDAGALFVPGGAPVRHESVIAHRYGPRDFLARRGLAAADIAALLVALIITALLAPSRGDGMLLIAIGAPFVLLAVPVFRAYGLYDKDAKRISHTTFDDLPGIFHALLIFGLLQWAYFRVMPVEQVGLPEVVSLACLGIALCAVFRSTTRIGLRKRMGPERLIIVGDGASAQALARKMRAHPEYGVVPAAMLRAYGPGGARLERRGFDAGVERFQRTASEGGGPVDLAELARTERAERLVLSHADLDQTAVVDLVFQARCLGLKVSLLPRPVDALGPSVEVDNVEGMTLLAVNPPVLARSSRVLKRTLDIVGASLGLLAMAPVFVVIATAIKLDSPGPVFFRQSRVGKRGDRFGLLKFRTMAQDAEARRAELLADSTDPNWLHLEHDPRITRVGRVLRQTSLDEFPQLWNVLRGQMSLVGPRPLIEDEDCLVDGFARHRLDLTPGMTGLWQVLGRTRIPFEEMVKLDYIYVTNWTLWGDVRLLLQTVGVVLKRQGAN